MAEIYNNCRDEKASIWHELKKWLIINICIGFFIPMLWSFNDYFSLSGWSRIWDDVVYSIVMASAISFTVYTIEAFLNRRLPWIKAPVLRFFLEAAMVTLLVLFTALLVNFMMYLVFGWMSINDIPWQSLWKSSQLPLIIGYVLTTFFISRHFLYEWRQSAITAEKLRAERYKGQVRFLKDQLNPHFLFNSLNVLTNVVYEDQDRAAHFIRELSKFYRYVLEVQHEELVPLPQEVDFAKRYAKLQKERFGEAFTFNFEFSPSSNELIPPLVLQLLIENALKHNAVSDARPLEVKVYKKNNQLVIWNNCNPKRKPEDSTGIGLNNIRERYQLLGSKLPQVNHTREYYQVTLPTIKNEL